MTPSDRLCGASTSPIGNEARPIQAVSPGCSSEVRLGTSLLSPFGRHRLPKQLSLKQLDGLHNMIFYTRVVACTFVFVPTDFLLHRHSHIQKPSSMLHSFMAGYTRGCCRLLLWQMTTSPYEE